MNLIEGYEGRPWGIGPHTLRMDEPAALPFRIEPGPDMNGGQVWLLVHEAGDVFEAQRWVVEELGVIKWAGPLAGTASEPG